MPSLDPALWGRRALLRLSLMEVLALHGMLSLALKHPKVAESPTRLYAARVLADCEAILLERRALSPAEIEEARAERPALPPHYICPACARVSFNANDIVQGYCGACHLFEDDALLLRRYPDPDA